MVKAMFVLYRRPDFDMQGFRSYADIPNFLDTSKIGMVVVEAHRIV